MAAIEPNVYDIPDDAWIDQASGMVYRQDANGNVVLLGPKTNFPLDYSKVGSIAQSGPLTPGDRARQSADNAKSLAIQGGIGGLTELAQAGLSAIPTVDDTRNNARIKTLEAAEASNSLGLTPDERAQAEATVLNPARALAAEARERSVAQVAASPHSSLAAQNAARLAADKAGADAAVKAGIAINQANIDARNMQEKELEARIQTKAHEQEDTISRVGNTISDLAKMGGRIAAAQVASREPTDAEVKAWQFAKNDKGELARPDLMDKTPDEARAAYMDAEKQARADQRAAKVQAARKSGALMGTKEEVDARLPAATTTYNPWDEDLAGAGAAMGGG